MRQLSVAGVGRTPPAKASHKTSGARGQIRGLRVKVPVAWRHWMLADSWIGPANAANSESKGSHERISLSARQNRELRTSYNQTDEVLRIRR